MVENSILNPSLPLYNLKPIIFKKEEITSEWNFLEGDIKFEWINDLEEKLQNHSNQTSFEDEYFIKEEEYDINEFFNDNREQEIIEEIDDFIDIMKNDEVTDELSEFHYIPSSTSEKTFVNDDNSNILNLSDQKKAFEAVLNNVQAQHLYPIVNFFSQITTEEVMLVDDITCEQQQETTRQVCALCNREFTKRCYLIQHINYKHSDKPFKCGKCSKKFVNQLKLDDHLEKHNFANKKWKCIASRCNKAYAYKADLKIHESNVHQKENKKHTCECGKSFSRKDHLKIHKRSHVNKLYKGVKAEI